MKNIDIITEWISNRPYSKRHKALSTDGANLFSYSLKIGYTNEQGKKVAIDYTSTGGYMRSMTTSQHVGLAKGKCDLIRNPCLEDDTAPIEIPVGVYDPKTFSK